MGVIDVGLVEESQARYLTYALSVVNSRALPDVRDGLKPVQRRILYAMTKNLSLLPDRAHRKSAAVVGEVLARYHPHGDAACYEAMVRMAQDFNFRYPLVDGQGNFGSLDGDSAAAYRYTEARLTALALEVVGDIGQETVAERDNFDQTVKEPVVLPSRAPQLLMNGTTGIAVGMATAIPPHNLRELVKALKLLLDDSSVSDAKILSAIKGPDFPTACLILNTRDEIREIYSSGRGAIRMRGEHKLEKVSRGKEAIVFTSIPYNTDKANLVEKIADLIIARKVPQIVDVRDESTDVVRIVLELAPSASAEKALAYLFKHTPLESNYNVNLTAIVPTENPLAGKPVLLSLRQMLEEFVLFRIEVTTKKLLFEKSKLDERIHLLEGLVSVLAHIQEVIKLVQQSGGRSEAAAKLEKRFKLTSTQSLFIVDLRIYQLSRTNIEEINSELEEKRKRVGQIKKILNSDKLLRKEISSDLERIDGEFGDERRSRIVSEFKELEFDAEEYVQHEDVYVLITRDGWIKRLRQTNDPETTRLREGDALWYSSPASTKDSLAIFTNFGNSYVVKVFDVVSTSGFGEPVQKMFRFGDGEEIVSAMVLPRNGKKVELLLFTHQGLGFRLSSEHLADTKKIGKRLIRLKPGDALGGVSSIESKSMLFAVSEAGYGLLFMLNEVPILSGPGKGVIVQRVGKGDRLVGAISVDRESIVSIGVGGGDREIDVSSLTIGSRAKKGNKVVKRGGLVKGFLSVREKGSRQG